MEITQVRSTFSDDDCQRQTEPSPSVPFGAMDKNKCTNPTTDTAGTLKANATLKVIKAAKDARGAKKVSRHGAFHAGRILGSDVYWMTQSEDPYYSEYDDVTVGYWDPERKTPYDSPNQIHVSVKPY